MYGKQLIQDLTTTGLLSGMTKLIMSQTGGGAAIAGAPAAVPLAVAGGVYAVKRLDDNVFDGAETGIKTVDSDNLTWYLINAVKELSTEVTTLKTEIAALKSA